MRMYVGLYERIFKKKLAVPIYALLPTPSCVIRYGKHSLVFFIHIHAMIKVSLACDVNQVWCNFE